MLCKLQTTDIYYLKKQGGLQMFKFKRLISSMVAFSMTTVMLATTAFASIPSDVKDTKYEEAAQVLGALGIMIGDENGKFRPDDAIIRSEVTKVGVTLMGLLEVAESYDVSLPYVKSFGC